MSGVWTWLKPDDGCRGFDTELLRRTYHSSGWAEWCGQDGDSAHADGYCTRRIVCLALWANLPFVGSTYYLFVGPISQLFVVHKCLGPTSHKRLGPTSHKCLGSTSLKCLGPTTHHLPATPITYHNFREMLLFL